MQWSMLYFFTATLRAVRCRWIILSRILSNKRSSLILYCGISKIKYLDGHKVMVVWDKHFFLAMFTTFLFATNCLAFSFVILNLKSEYNTQRCKITLNVHPGILFQPNLGSMEEDCIFWGHFNWFRRKKKVQILLYYCMYYVLFSCFTSWID